MLYFTYKPINNKKIHNKSVKISKLDQNYGQNGSMYWE